MKVRDNKDGTQTYLFAGEKYQFQQAALDQAVQAGHAEPVLLFSATTSNFDDALTEVLKITADKDLSESGRVKKLEPVRTQGVIVVAAGYAAIDDYSRSLDRREAELLRVPDLVPTHTAMAVEDQELRAWFLRLDAKSRADLLLRMEEGPELMRLQLALLRGPGAILVADHDAAQVRDLWNRQRRMDNPGEALHIANGKITTEWSRRGVQHIGGMAARALGWDSQRILRAIVQSKNDRARLGLAVFGFGERDALQMEHQLETRQFVGVA